ncbi:MAG: ATP12 chaperone family protein [Alphaproteobacteria bacterium]|nr:ATP12 chaperone family protein [Alphaproteobacteria bacterium]
MKRFYKLVSSSREQGGHTITLDGRPVKTRAGEKLLCKTESLAQELVKEWASQGEQIRPDTMPLTQILNTMTDRVSRERAAMSAAVLKYLDTDLICYRVENPPALCTLQEEIWSPWSAWFEEKFKHPLATTTGLQALAQNQVLHKAVAEYVEAMEDDHFTILQLVTSLSGSIILALAFTDQAATPKDILRAMFLEEDFKDELYNAERHGPDPMLSKARAAAEIDLNGAQTFLENI